MEFLIHCGTFFISYLIGAISFAVLVAKSKGVDIFHVGSGNPGATNVSRVLGIRYGRFVFFLDALKGFLPVFFVHFYLHEYPRLAHKLASMVLLGTVVGHNFSIFLRFRGGRGVATSIGGLLALMPNVTLFCLVTWYSVFKVTRFVSLASLCFALMLPLLAYLFAYPKELFQLSVILTVLIFIRHIPNIRRLWHGTESRS